MPLYDAFISYSHAKDKPIASALQSVMQKLGKPWYRRRALRVFRDDTSLSATPHLWPSIETALSQSRYLILLASPEAANSPWIAKEIEYWLDHNSADALFIGLTDSELAWEEKKGDFKWTPKNPLPKVLKGRFAAQPRWVDLRVYRDGAEPRNAKLIELGADFAAAIHGMPKEDLLSQEVRQQRRALRLAWSAAGTLLALLVIVFTVGWLWRSANSERVLAADRALTARGRYLADLARQNDVIADYGTAIDLGIEALTDPGSPGRVRDIPEAERALHQALWNLKEAHVLGGYRQWLSVIRFSPDGKELLAASNDGTARLWDVATGKQIALLIGHSQGISAAEFSPDGRTIATGSLDGGMRLWRGDSGELLTVLPRHENTVTDLSFSPDGKRLASASWDMRPWIADLNGKNRVLLLGHINHVWSVDFSPDGRSILTSADDGTARLYDPTNGNLLHEFVVVRGGGPAGGVLSARFLPGANEMLTTSRDGSAIVWDVRGGTQIAAISGIDVACSHCSDISPDGAFIAAVKIKGSGVIFEARSGKIVSLLALPPSNFAVSRLLFSRDSSKVLAACSDGSARLYARDGALLETFGSHGDGLVDAILSLDETIVATAGRDGTARLWERLPIGGTVKIAPPKDWPIDWALYSPDSTKMAVGSGDQLEIRASATGELLASFAGQLGPIISGMFSADGSYLATISDKDNSIWLWNVAAGKTVGQLRGHRDRITDINFAPNNRLLLSSSNDGTVRLWDAATGQQRAVLEGHAGIVTSASFSPGGAHILTTSQDQTARLWDLKGHTVAVLGGHTDEVATGTFSSDGSVVATASVDQTVRLWDGQTGAARRVLEGANGNIFQLKFVAADRLVATSTDGVVRLWDIARGIPLVTSPRGMAAFATTIDGRLLALVWNSQEAKVFNTQSGSQVATVTGARAPLNMLMFSPRGEMLVGRSNYDIQFWRLPSGDRVAELQDGFDNSPLIALSPDGRQLARRVGGSLQLVPVWLSPAELVDAGTKLSPRKLTPEQRRRFFLE